MDDAVLVRLGGFALLVFGCGRPLIGVDDGGGGGGSEGGGGDTGETEGGSGEGSGEGGSGESTASIPVVPGCGDGIVDLDEDCDDGNGLDGDGCNADCTPSGTLRWFRELDAGAADFGQHIAIASDGSIAIAGVRATADGVAPLPFAAAFDPAGELLWDADLTVGRAYVGGVIAGAGGTARVVAYEEGHVPLVLGVEDGEIADAAVVGLNGMTSFGFATIERFADGSYAVGGRSEPGVPWIERYEEPTSLAFTLPFGEFADADVWQIAPIDGDVIVLLEDHHAARRWLTRVTADGERLWSTPIACSGAVTASSTRITVGDPTTVLCALTPEGEPIEDPFSGQLEAPAYDVDAVVDGDILVATSADTTVVTITRLDALTGPQWTTDIAGFAGYIVPFRGAVARDGSSAFTGVLAHDAGYNAFVFALSP